MDVKVGGDEVSVSSLIINSPDSQLKEDFSPEDLAWVDSCLIGDSDISESNWSPIRDALLEIFSSQPESSNTDGAAHIEILPSSEDIGNTQFQGLGNGFIPVKVVAEESPEAIPNNKKTNTLSSYNLQENPSLPITDEDMKVIGSFDSDMPESSENASIYNILPVSIATASSVDDNPDNEEVATEPSLAYQGNPFLPTYSEDLKQSETIDSGLNLNSSVSDMVHSSEDIFKIWDLGIPPEEGELVKQLNKALAGHSITPSSFDDLGEGRGSKYGSLDHLIASLADLSLDQSSS